MGTIDAQTKVPIDWLWKAVALAFAILITGGASIWWAARMTTEVSELKGGIVTLCAPRLVPNSAQDADREGRGSHDNRA